MFHVLFTLLYVHSSIAIILVGKRELVALLNLSSWCLEMVERLFLAVPFGCLRFVVVVCHINELEYHGIAKLVPTRRLPYRRRIACSSSFCPVVMVGSGLETFMVL